MKRQQRLQLLQSQSEFDVVVLGGGINGACLYDTLCQKGYKVLLVDKGDFASGTSQSSGMMIWGGLLYLRNLDLASVFKLSADRDRILRDKKNWMAPITMRYLPSTIGRAKSWVHFGLWLYWLMGLGRRTMPRSEQKFCEHALLKPGLVKGSLTYEEGFVEESDARFVYRWLASDHSAEQSAVNYCNVSGAYNASDKRWHLDLQDSLSADTYEIKAAMIVNCAGVWTDEVNAQFGITSPFRHVLSKGVYLGIPRDPQHQSTLVFDLGEHNDVITHAPWGPISLWGPTETAVDHIADGLVPTHDDIDYLLMHYARRYRTPIKRADIISMRCGIRPLVVDTGYSGSRYPLDLSRRQEVIRDAGRPWISCYGGKLTGCSRMAQAALKLIEKSIAATARKQNKTRADISTTQPGAPQPDAPQTAFPGLSQPVVSAAWSADHELCCTLDDYLRRRTNIAQWVPRGGFGDNDCNAQTLKNIAVEIAGGNLVLADQLFAQYRAKILQEFAPLMTGTSWFKV